jgi:hypothetical protein
MVKAYNNNYITIYLKDEDLEFLEFISSTSNISIQRIVEPGVIKELNEYRKIEEQRRNQLYKEGYGPIIW